MSNIDDIIERLLVDRRINEGAAFSSRTYSDQPIIERGSDFKARMEQRAAARAERRSHEAEVRRKRKRAARPKVDREYTEGPIGVSPSVFEMLFQRPNAPIRTAPREPLPERIREMRALENGGLPSTLAYGSVTAASLFHRQAQLMADYEDDYEFHGAFSQYYPTYAAMSNHQLRGYFSWRTRVRAGLVQPAPLSFAFVYVYELLMGVGVEPGEPGYEALRDFGIAYRDADETSGAQLAGYLHRWLRDYAIYHERPDLLGTARTDELGEAVLTLLCAEHAFLRQAGCSPRIENPATQGDQPTTEQLFRALGNAASYHLCESRLAKAEPELVALVARDVFEALVMHCSKRRKTDFVEGLFGYASNLPCTLFSAAVFHEDHPHPDCTVELSRRETYVCKDGRWRRLLACEATSRSSELGTILHAVDHELRVQLDYPYPLKERTAPKYLLKIVRTSVAARLAERAEAERRKITIDLGKLRGIREAAALTQEALLTDEERDELPAPAPQVTPPLQPEPAKPTAAPAPQEPSAPTADERRSPEAPAHGAPSPAPMEPPTTLGLTEPESRLLLGLLEGRRATELLTTADPFVSVVADSINEKLFDLVGDAVIEFDGDEPFLVEDYLDDIREALQP